MTCRDWMGKEKKDRRLAAHTDGRVGFYGCTALLLCCEIRLTNNLFVTGLDRVSIPLGMSERSGPVRGPIHNLPEQGSLRVSSTNMHLMYTFDAQGNRVYTLKVSVLTGL
jgi:hypothetical protein